MRAAPPPPPGGRPAAQRLAGSAAFLSLGAAAKARRAATTSPSAWAAGRRPVVRPCRARILARCGALRRPSPGKGGRFGSPSLARRLAHRCIFLSAPKPRRDCGARPSPSGVLRSRQRDPNSKDSSLRKETSTYKGSHSTFAALLGLGSLLFATQVRLADGVCIGCPGRQSEAYKRGRIKRGRSQKTDLRIGGETGPRHIQNTGRVP